MQLCLFNCSHNAIKATMFLLSVELYFVLLKGIKMFKETVTSYIGSYVMLLWEHSDICNSSNTEKMEEILFFLLKTKWFFTTFRSSISQAAIIQQIRVLVAWMYQISQTELKSLTLISTFIFQYLLMLDLSVAILLLLAFLKKKIVWKTFLNTNKHTVGVLSLKFKTLWVQRTWLLPCRTNNDNFPCLPALLKKTWNQFNWI